MTLAGEDFIPGDATSVTGQFIPVPPLIASGRHPDGTEVMAADFGFPLPPNDGTWQRDPNGVGIDGPQWVLEYWSQQNDVFNFVRVEDIAYDKRPGMSNVAYIVDSGRGTSGISQAGRSTNGRVWKMVLDPKVFAAPASIGFGLLRRGARAARTLELTDAGGGAGSWTTRVSTRSLRRPRRLSTTRGFFRTPIDSSTA